MKKLLVIDDDRINLRILTKVLIDAGYDVTPAVDGDIGLDRVQREMPDLILLDIEMPRVNGYQFLKTLQADAFCKDIPIIILTSHENMEPTFKRLGIKDYLIKPVDQKKLLQLIDSYFTA